jgi:hypothetical protein
VLIERLFANPRLCCPGCGAPFQELLADTPVADGSVIGAFLLAAAPELIGWSAVGVGWLAGGWLGVGVGLGLFVPLAWGALRLERKLTSYGCMRCGRRSRYADLVRA